MTSMFSPNPQHPADHLTPTNTYRPPPPAPPKWSTNTDIILLYPAAPAAGARLSSLAGWEQAGRYGSRVLGRAGTGVTSQALGRAGWRAGTSTMLYRHARSTQRSVTWFAVLSRLRPPPATTYYGSGKTGFLAGCSLTLRNRWLDTGSANNLPAWVRGSVCDSEKKTTVFKRNYDMYVKQRARGDVPRAQCATSP